MHTKVGISTHLNRTGSKTRAQDPPARACPPKSASNSERARTSSCIPGKGRSSSGAVLATILVPFGLLLRAVDVNHAARHLALDVQALAPASRLGLLQED